MLRHLTNWVKSAEHSIEDKEDEGEDSADEEFVYISEIDDDLSEEEDLSEYEPEPSTILNVDDVGYGQLPVAGQSILCGNYDWHQYRHWSQSNETVCSKK